MFTPPRRRRIPARAWRVEEEPRCDGEVRVPPIGRNKCHPSGVLPGKSTEGREDAGVPRHSKVRPTVQYQHAVYERTLTVMIPTASDHMAIPGVATQGDLQESPVEDGASFVSASLERAWKPGEMPMDDYLAMVVHSTLDGGPIKRSWERD